MAAISGSAPSTTSLLPCYQSKRASKFATDDTASLGKPDGVDTV